LAHFGSGGVAACYGLVALAAQTGGMTGLHFLAALLTGGAVALVLEASLLRTRSRHWRQSGLWLTLAIVCIVAAWLAWQTASLPAALPPLISPLPADFAETKEEVAQPLPAPVIRILQANTAAAVDTAVSSQPSNPQPIRLQIPALQVDEAIQPVPLRDGRWDVSELGGQVGLLATTGQSPNDTLAMVFAGHMTFPTANLLHTGAFADLQYATYGTQIVVQTAEKTLVYEVAEISRLAPEAVDRLYLADHSSILLITCTDWAEPEGVYANRLLIRAQAVASNNTGPGRFTGDVQ
jgi:LPXTG-site transpeptidase (sortase) family protein